MADAGRAGRAGSGLLRSTCGRCRRVLSLGAAGVDAPMDGGDRAVEMSRDLAQAVAVLDVRGHDPLAVIRRADEIGERRTRRPHHRPGELWVPRHTRKPLDDEDIVAGNKRVPRRRRVFERLDQQPKRRNASTR